MIQFDLENGDSVLDPAHAILIEGCEKILNIFGQYRLKLTCRISAPGKTHGKNWYAQFALNGIKSPYEIRHPQNSPSLMIPAEIPCGGEWMAREPHAIAETYLATSFGMMALPSSCVFMAKGV